MSISAHTHTQKEKQQSKTRQTERGTGTISRSLPTGRGCHHHRHRTQKHNGLVTVNVRAKDTASPHCMWERPSFSREGTIILKRMFTENLPWAGHCLLEHSQSLPIINPKCFEISYVRIKKFFTFSNLLSNTFCDWVKKCVISKPRRKTDLQQVAGHAGAPRLPGTLQLSPRAWLPPSRLARMAMAFYTLHSCS